MKRYTLYIYAFALSAFALSSCSKGLTEGLDDVSVGVTTNENVVYDGMIVKAKKGQPVEFVINGAPDFVTFYSGELGHQYAYHDRTSISAEDVMDAELSFYCYMTGNHFTGDRDNNMLYMYYAYEDAEVGETGFPGLVKDNFDADYATVKDFAWTHEIAPHADFANLGTDIVKAMEKGAFTLPVKDYIGKNLVIAIGYNKDELVNTNQRPVAEGGKPLAATNQHGYRFDSMNITTTLRNGQEVNQYASNFKFTALNLDDKSYTTVENQTAGRWNLTGASGGNFFIQDVASSTDWKTSWLVSDPIDILACEPDKGTSIKNVSQDLPTYSYTYENVGTYTATFVVTNGNYKHEDRGVYQIVVNVTE